MSFFSKAIRQVGIGVVPRLPRGSLVQSRVAARGLRGVSPKTPGIPMRPLGFGLSGVGSVTPYAMALARSFSQQPLSQSSKPVKLAPLDMGKGLMEIGREIIALHFPKPIVDEALALVAASKASVGLETLADETVAVDAIRARLQRVSPEKYKVLVNVLYVLQTLESLDVSPTPTATSTTPLRDAMTRLLDTMPLSDAIDCIPRVLTDVLTTHPVKGDSGTIVGLRLNLKDTYQKWTEGIDSYRHANEDAKPRVCEHVDRLRAQMMEYITYLCTTNPVPTVRVLPEEEQQTISAVVKGVERPLLDALSRARRVVLSSFLEKMAKEIADTSPAFGNELRALMNLPPEERLDLLRRHPEIKAHPAYDQVMRASDFGYTIERWTVDMDGHPLVNARTGARAMAAGRVLAFGDLSEEDALVKFSDHAVPPDVLNEITKRLKGVESDPGWGAYIGEKLARGWPLVKIYSGLVYFRIEEAKAGAKAGAKAFLRDPHASFSLLKQGFPHSRRFEKLVAPLVSAEQALGIRGFWSQQLDLVRLRGIELGAPHIRIGESFYAKLVSDSLHILSPETYPSPTDFLTLPIAEQKKVLAEFRADPTPKLPLGFDAKLGVESGRLYRELRDVLSLSPFATMIASDAAGDHGDAAYPVEVLRRVSNLMGHRGPLVPLFEDMRAMKSAIALLTDPTVPDAFFERVCVQTAGSDNQKRSGPFLAGVLNDAFLTAAKERGVPSFFGRGCSPFRSSTSQFPFDMVTVQPGQLHREFNTSGAMPYLFSRIAAQLDAATTRKRPVSTKEKQAYIMGTIADHVHGSLRADLSDYPEIRTAAKSFAGIQTNFHSRPPGKAGLSAKEKDVLDTMRAIGLAKFQLGASTVDPQMAGSLAGVRQGIAQLVAEGMPLPEIHCTYRETPAGKALLATLGYFHDLIDPAMPTQGIRQVGSADIANTYFLLTGAPIPTQKTDPMLRLARLVFSGAPQSCLPDTLLLLPEV